MNKIPTAEEFLSDNINRVAIPLIDDELEDDTQFAQTLKECLIEFAKLHVQAALEAASQKAQLVLRKYKVDGIFEEELMGQEITTESEMEYTGISAKSILSAYPLTNIQ